MRKIVYNNNVHKDNISQFKGVNNMAQIIKDSGNLSPEELYFLTKSPAVQKMTSKKGAQIGVSKWCVYEETDANNVPMEIMAILTPDGEMFATNSPTFIRDFGEMVDFFHGYGKDVHTVEVISGTSKNGREFITCTFVN